MSVATAGRPVNPGTPAPAPAPAGRGPRGLLADRRVQVAGIAALVVVAVALGRRGATASDVAEGTSRGASTMDTTGADIEQAIASALGDVYGRLDDISSGLAKTPQQQVKPIPPASQPLTPAQAVAKLPAHLQRPAQRALWRTKAAR